ncbi:tagaturonate reductase [Paenibacillus sp. 19GGS1-52]|uniref:tagaturonate reductase n=1 Tax=Paenibacillus sp. 19GGS1-52 TaxID=2758563 RepID=UPI001EFC2575|nr:tagaturonate reductase [Paenibacillus sp. 19GGS1-52]ULO07428.1 tagaturonate reductase [Paenibacillus sp. 19GGS1-52]
MERLNSDNWKAYKQYPEKVLQFGEGNFMRAFVDWQIHKMNQQTDFNGGVVVVQPLANGLSEMLNEQNGLYTLYLQGIKDGEALKEHEVINCITRTLNPYTQHAEYLQLAENPELRFVVSNTTEAGIAFEAGDKLNDAPQSSFPGKLTALLHRRYEFFGGDSSKGFILIPCELIDRNGDELKKIVLKYAELWNLGEGFVNWLNEANTFCCSLVDRIVPGYPRDSIAEITAELGYEDKLVVVGEQFHLWVIEGPGWIKNEFPAHLAGLNVLVVDDMTPYRTRKVRILNGAHTALTPVAYLYGIDTVAEAIEHEEVGPFVKSLIYEEIIPTLDLPVEELNSFADAVLERFLNPYVQHYLMSISLNSVSKFKTRDLPSLLQYVESKGQLPEKLVFSLSALISFYSGRRGSEVIQLADDADILEWFAALWKSCDGSEASLRVLTAEVLGATNRWGCNLNEVAGLTDKVAQGLFAIEKLGMKQALQDLVKKPAHN